MHYQGRIMNANGPLRNSNVSFEFSITSPAGTCVLFREQISGVDMQNSQGVFDTSIGTGSRIFPSSGALNINDVFKNYGTLTCEGGATYAPAHDDTRRLRVRFHDGIGWRLVTPDNIIRSVPYAVVATSAERLGAFYASDYLRKAEIPVCTGGQVLTSSTLGVLSCAAGGGGSSGGAAGSSGAPSISFTGDTDTGFYNASSNDTISVSTGGTQIFNFVNSGLVSPTTGGANITSAAGSATTPTFSFAGDTDTGWFRPAENTLAASLGGQERVRISPEGRLGVGTPAPLAPFHLTQPAVAGTISSVGTAVTGTGTSFTTDFKVGDAIAAYSGGLQSKTITAIASDTNLTVDSAFASDLASATYFRTAMYTDTNAGLIGIGTANPLAQLHVNGNLRVTGRITSEFDGGNQLFVESYRSNTLGGGLTIRHARGTRAAPTALTNNDANTIYFSNYTGTTFSDGASITSRVDNATSSFGTALVIGTREASTSIRDRLRVTGTGNVIVGAATTTNGSFFQVSRTLPTGTISTSGTTVTGDSTNFTTAFAVGDQIIAGGQSRTITAIDLNTSMTVNTPFSSNLPLTTPYTRVAATFEAGNVGIGTANPLSPLHVYTANTYGNIASFLSASGGCSIAYNGTTCSSDARLKENIHAVDSEETLKKLLQVRPSHFTWIKDSQHEKQTGFIAQEIQKLFPEFVKEDSQGYLQVNYAAFVSVLTSAVQELNSRSEAKDQKIHDLEKRLEKQEAELQVIKKKLGL